MNQTYERMRAELATAEEMLKKTKNPDQQARLSKQIKQLKHESHALLQTIHSQAKAEKEAAIAKREVEQRISIAAHNASLKGVVSEYMPKRLRIWLHKEAGRRASGAAHRSVKPWDWVLVLVGLRK